MDCGLFLLLPEAKVSRIAIFLLFHITFYQRLAPTDSARRRDQQTDMWRRLVAPDYNLTFYCRIRCSYIDFFLNTAINVYSFFNVPAIIRGLLKERNSLIEFFFCSPEVMASKLSQYHTSYSFMIDVFLIHRVSFSNSHFCYFPSKSYWHHPSKYCCLTLYY